MCLNPPNTTELLAEDAVFAMLIVDVLMGGSGKFWARECKMANKVTWPVYSAQYGIIQNKVCTVSLRWNLLSLLSRLQICATCWTAWMTKKTKPDIPDTAWFIDAVFFVTYYWWFLEYYRWDTSMFSPPDNSHFVWCSCNFLRNFVIRIRFCSQVLIAAIVMFRK